VTSRPNDTAEDAAVRDLARQADPLDMMARLMVAGYKITPNCEDCGGTGKIECTDAFHVSWPTSHKCTKRDCGKCEARRYNLLRASIEAQCILYEEYDSHGNRIAPNRVGVGESKPVAIVNCSRCDILLSADERITAPPTNLCDRCFYTTNRVGEGKAE
jgi:hypothetical protein